MHFKFKANLVPVFLTQDFVISKTLVMETVCVLINSNLLPLCAEKQLLPVILLKYVLVPVELVLKINFKSKAFLALASLTMGLVTFLILVMVKARVLIIMLQVLLPAEQLKMLVMYQKHVMELVVSAHQIYTSRIQLIVSLV